jgi:hypothetical protein
MREYFFTQRSQRKLAQRSQSFYHKLIKGNKVNLFDDHIFHAKIAKEISEKIAKFFYHKLIKGNKVNLFDDNIFSRKDHKGN